MIGFILFMSVSLLVIRLFLALEIWCAMTKGERKKYKKSCSFLNRWFFLSTPDYVSGKYVKSEGKRINYPRIAMQNRFIAISLHALYLLTLPSAILLWNKANEASESLLSGICFFYALFVLAVFGFLAIRESITYNNYHHSRKQRRL